MPAMKAEISYRYSSSVYLISQLLGLLAYALAWLCSDICVSMLFWEMWQFVLVFMK